MKRIESAGDIAFRERLHSGFECRIFLTHDFVEMRGAHSCLLQLLEWPASLDALVLARVTDQKNAVLRPEPAKELAHLVCARQGSIRRQSRNASFPDASRLVPRARNPCSVPVSTPASPSCRAAREVGASPSTVYP